MVEAGHRLSQSTFDRMLDLIHRIKNHAVRNRDDNLWGMADHLDALLHRFVTDMIVEEPSPIPAPRRNIITSLKQDLKERHHYAAFLEEA